MKDPEATRKLLLESAFRVVYEKGFKTASLKDILADTGLTKGALYHHFPNKQALGLALLDSIEAGVEALWLQHLAVCENPLDCLRRTLEDAVDQLSEEELVLGCPLNNLALEMSTLDEVFRQRVVAIYDRWQDGVEQALRRGQRAGQVLHDLDPKAVAAFYVASLAGGRGLAKTTRSPAVLRNCVNSLSWYLASLRQPGA